MFYHGFATPRPLAQLPSPLGSAIRCLRAAKFPCALTDYERNLRELIDAVRALPAGSRIFVDDRAYGQAIRHAARQPVVFTGTEGSWFIYAGDFEGMLKFHNRQKAFAKLEPFLVYDLLPNEADGTEP